MNEIINFVKEILMLETNEKCPVGLCSFENTAETKTVRKTKHQRKREMRLSELME